MQKPWWSTEAFEDDHWDFPAVVSVLSALLHAHARVDEPILHQQALLLRASAQLASMPCALHPCQSSIVRRARPPLHV